MAESKKTNLTEKELNQVRLAESEKLLVNVMKKYVGAEGKAINVFKLNGNDAKQYASELVKLFYNNLTRDEHVWDGDTRDPGYQTVKVENEEFLNVFGKVLVYGIVPVEIFNEKNGNKQTIIEVIQSSYSNLNEIEDKIFKIALDHIGDEKDSLKLTSENYQAQRNDGNAIYKNARYHSLKIGQDFDDNNRDFFKTILYHSANSSSESGRKLFNAIIDIEDFKSFYSNQEVISYLFKKLDGERFDKLIDFGLSANINEAHIIDKNVDVLKKAIIDNASYKEYGSKFVKVLEKCEKQNLTSKFFEDHKVFHALATNGKAEVAFKYAAKFEKLDSLLQDSKIWRDDDIGLVFAVAKKQKKVKQYFGEDGLSSLLKARITKTLEGNFWRAERYDDSKVNEVFDIAIKNGLSKDLFKDAERVLSLFLDREKSNYGKTRYEKDKIDKFNNKINDKSLVRYLKIMVSEGLEDQHLDVLINKVGIANNKKWTHDSAEIMYDIIVRNIDKVEQKKLESFKDNLKAKIEKDGKNEISLVLGAVDLELAKRKEKTNNEFQNILGEVAVSAYTILEGKGPKRLEELAREASPNLFQTKVKPGNAFTRWATEKVEKLFGAKDDSLKK